MSHQVEIKRSREFDEPDESAHPGHEVVFVNDSVFRETVFESGDAIVRRARSTEENVQDWHHHGEWEVFGYVIEGRTRLEFGPNGEQFHEPSTCDFFHIPAGVVHRAIHPPDQLIDGLAVMVGSGERIHVVEGPGDP
jgi:uncharacterized protein YjlB